jgi:hypothetical protein
VPQQIALRLFLELKLNAKFASLSIPFQIMSVFKRFQIVILIPTLSSILVNNAKEDTVYQHQLQEMVQLLPVLQTFKELKIIVKKDSQLLEWDFVNILFQIV